MLHPAKCLVSPGMLHGAVMLHAVNPGPQRVADMHQPAWNMELDRNNTVSFIHTIPLLSSDSQPVTRVCGTVCVLREMRERENHEGASLFFF